MLTGLQAAVQLVVIVVRVSGAMTACAFGCPEQLTVIVVLEVPPLYATRLISRLGDTNENVALRGVAPLKEMLTDVSLRQGGDVTHCAVPQLITPLGYWP